jgi:hypothetical protein
VALMAEAQVTGVVSLAMAARHGVPARTVRRRAAKEQWLRLQRGVWLLPGFADTHRRRCHAVQQRAGERVVIGGRSAALAHGLRHGVPDAVEVVVARDRDVPTFDGVRGRESRKLRRRDVVQQEDGLWVITPAWTIADLSRLLDAESVLYAAIAGRQAGQHTEDELEELCARLWPATGTAVLAWVIEEMRSLDSGFEWTVRRGLAAAGLPAPHPEPYELACPDGRTIHLDVAWSPWRVGLEVMGVSAHGMQTSRTDQIRHNQATAGDWTILYVGWERWREERRKVLDELRTVLRARGAAA